MIYFPTPLDFSNAGYTNGKRKIRVKGPFKAITSKGVIEVADGFISDGASIPKFAWSIVGHPFEEFLEECVIHDWLYETGQLTRLEADNILLELMYNRKIPLWKVNAFWLAVRIGGGKYYNKNMKVKFDNWFKSMRFRNFKPDEFTWYFSKVRHGVRNEFPPEPLWKNIIPTLLILDELRDYFGKPLTINSTYRGLSYNRKIGSPDGSLHRKFNAIDFTIEGITPNQISEVLKAWRAKGKFKGGIGTYRKFVHLDTRPNNATW